MKLGRAFAVVAISAAAGAAIGLLLGLALGLSMPGYYRGTIAGGDRPDFSPVQVGAGLGFSQGLIGGAAVGCVVLLAVAWSTRPPPGPPTH